VFCVDINLSAAEETANIITGEGGLALPFRADVTKENDVEAIVKACVSDFGRIDVLDNNVGIAEVGGVVELPLAQWNRVLDVNLKSAFLHLEARHPADGGSGRRFDHQHLLGRRRALDRRPLCLLLRLEGRAACISRARPRSNMRASACA
jgi:NAD(P)-dependent dehydrogenase (short-subunit alcohol dehydrogenase family)